MWKELKAFKEIQFSSSLMMLVEFGHEKTKTRSLSTLALPKAPSYSLKLLTGEGLIEGTHASSKNF